MPKVVFAVPYWESDIEKREVLKKCLSSLKGQDEIIVVAGKQRTLPTAWNMCLELGFGMGADYVVLSNDDIELVEGDLTMLCEPDKVVSPLVNDSIYKIFHAHIFCIPRSVWERVGAFDENFQVMWSDTDYAKRMVGMGIEVKITDRVKVLHPEPGRTINIHGGLTEASDREKYVKKWGVAHFDPVTGVTL